MRGRSPQQDKTKMGPHPNRMQAVRLAAGLTQQQVSERSGMAVQTYSKLERWFIKLHAGHLRRLAPVLGVHAMELLHGGPALTVQQREILRLMEDLDATEQERVLSIVRMVLQPGGQRVA